MRRERQVRQLERSLAGVLILGLSSALAWLVMGFLTRRRWDAESSLALAFVLLFVAALIDELRSGWHRYRRTP